MLNDRANGYWAWPECGPDGPDIRDGEMLDEDGDLARAVEEGRWAYYDAWFQYIGEFE